MGIKKLIAEKSLNNYTELGMMIIKLAKVTRREGSI
jgi:hypothetical protein